MNDCIRFIVASMGVALSLACASTDHPSPHQKTLSEAGHAEPVARASACREDAARPAEPSPNARHMENAACRPHLLRQTSTQSDQNSPSLAESVELPETPIPVPRGVGGVGIFD